MILWTVFQAQCQCKPFLPCVNTHLCCHNSPYGPGPCTPPGTDRAEVRKHFSWWGVFETASRDEMGMYFEQRLFYGLGCAGQL